MTTNQQHAFLTWKVAGILPKIQVDFSVIDRLSVDVMRGVGVTRRRGTEVGGVLLGTIDPGPQAMVHISAYEIVPCEYSQGPSYVLSENDLNTFRDAISRWRRPVSPDQYIVGYFRSHTRDGLYLDEADAKLFHENIDDPLAIALVIKPYITRASEAGFFIQSDEKLITGATALVFPFARAEYALGDEPEAALEPPAPIEPPTPAPQPAPPVLSVSSAPDLSPDLAPVPPSDTPVPVAVTQLAPERTPHPQRPAPPIFSTYYPESRSAWRTRFLWCAFTLAVFGFGAVAGYQYAGGRTWPLTLAAGKPADPYTINLSATAQERNVLLRWDRTSEAVKSAARGTLTITEPAGSREVSLDGAEVRNGTVLYQKATPEASFRLQLHFNDNRVFAETVTVGGSK